MAEVVAVRNGRDGGRLSQAAGRIHEVGAVSRRALGARRPAAAARASARTKQLAELDGMPLLEHALRTMRAAPIGRVVVVLGSGAEEIACQGRPPRRRAGRLRALGGGPVGLARAAACAELADCEAVVVTLGDQPRMSPDAIRRVVAGREMAPPPSAPPTAATPATRCSSSTTCSSALRDVTGDKGARNLLLSVPVRDIPCDDLGGGEDVDTRDELDALRGRPGDRRGTGRVKLEQSFEVARARRAGLGDADRRRARGALPAGRRDHRGRRRRHLPRHLQRATGSDDGRLPRRAQDAGARRGGAARGDERERPGQARAGVGQGHDRQHHA